jgi:eukaryotic-like serine/threonine-protein kinase
MIVIPETVPENIRRALCDHLSHVDITRFDDRGHNGYVFFGLNTFLQRNVVIKFYYWGGERASYPEPQRLAGLDHEGILKVFDAAPVDDDWAYFVTPFCEYDDLDHLLSQGVPGIVSAVDIAMKILSGLSYLHSCDYVHCDLKPLNIFRDGQDSFRIGDFGSVKQLGGAPHISTLSRHSLIYRAPESVQSRTYSRLSDIYQIGIVLYQLLGGSLPYEEVAYLSRAQRAQYDSLPVSERQFFATDIIEQLITRGRVAKYETLPCFVPASIKRVVRKACNTDPDRRFASASDFLIELNRKRSELRDWRTIDGLLTLSGPTSYRLVEAGGVFNVEKARSSSWRAISAARGLTLEAAVAFVEREASS